MWFHIYRLYRCHFLLLFALLHHVRLQSCHTNSVTWPLPSAAFLTLHQDALSSFPHPYISLSLYIYNPPCIAHYKVDILCAYKVGFRSPLYIPTMGDKAVFCARNMPLDLEDDFIRTLAFQFIPGWFPTRKRLNICGNAFYRPLVPFKEWP